PVVRSGKLVVATDPREIPALDELERRGRANGLQGMRRLTLEELKEIEPEVAGITGLWVPEAGLVDFAAVAAAIARKVECRGGELRTGFRVTGVQQDGSGLVISGSGGEVRARAMVNCAGLYSDRIARMCGVEPNLQIIPFRG